jgi:hypothetical protein
MISATDPGNRRLRVDFRDFRSSEVVTIQTPID